MSRIPCMVRKSFFTPHEKAFAFFNSMFQTIAQGRSRSGMEDRRQSPRITFTRKTPGFFVTLSMKRFFFRDKEITCKLRDLSEGGASLLVNDEFTKYIKENCVGRIVHLLSENPEVSFRLHRKGRIMRIIRNKDGVTVVVIFSIPTVE